MGRYLVWRSPLYSNGIGAGALALLASQAFNSICQMYAMDAVRMRMSRVKEMFLLSGLPRLSYWLANMCAHLILYWIAFGIGFLVLGLIGGMDGVKHNSFVGYFVLHVLFSPAVAMVAYIISFLFTKEEAAQVLLIPILSPSLPPIPAAAVLLSFFLSVFRVCVFISDHGLECVARNV